MGTEAHEFYEVLGSLLKALVGILIAFFAVFTFAYMFPLILRAMRTPGFETLSEAIRESARDFGGSLGSLVWAIFGLIIAIFVIWAFAIFLPALFKAKIFRQIKMGDDAFDTLRLRYVKGEITKDQYLEMKKILQEES
ncbi:MAG: hypothetical protein NTX81_01170 [Candidatus Bathyarchaeota archaeon]|nr:hypothetical protein [Candidatus Bathyarchaeota archaeon]